MQPKNSKNLHHDSTHHFLEVSIVLTPKNTPVTSISSRRWTCFFAFFCSLLFTTNKPENTDSINIRCAVLRSYIWGRSSRGFLIRNTELFPVWKNKNFRRRKMPKTVSGTSQAHQLYVSHPANPKKQGGKRFLSSFYGEDLISFFK